MTPPTPPGTGGTPPSAITPPPLGAGSAADKAQWRQWARAVRAAQPDVSGAISEHLSDLLRKLGTEGSILAYHALPGEPDLRSLQGEFRLLTTRARVRPEPRLTVHAWESATERSPLGILQPPRAAPEVPVSELGAVVLPALAFDRRGLRLGYGGGFYDRFLAGLRATGTATTSGAPTSLPAATPAAATTIGVTHSALLLDRVPSEPHDIPLDWIVTELGAGCPARDGRPLTVLGCDTLRQFALFPRR